MCTLDRRTVLAHRAWPHGLPGADETGVLRVGRRTRRPARPATRSPCAPTTRGPATVPTSPACSASAAHPTSTAGSTCPRSCSRPRDPYLLGHRPFLVPHRELARQVWRSQASPGALVLDGAVRGTWRQRVSGRTLTLHVTPFTTLGKGIRAAVRGAGALHAEVVWAA